MESVNFPLVCRSLQFVLRVVSFNFLDDNFFLIFFSLFEEVKREDVRLGWRQVTRNKSYRRKRPSCAVKWEKKTLQLKGRMTL